MSALVSLGCSKRVLAFAGSVAFAACTLACAAEPARPAFAPKVHWVPGYVLGIWGKGEIDVRDDCPETGAKSIRIGATWGTFLVSLLSLGIYTPREVRMECQVRP